MYKGKRLNNERGSVLAIIFWLIFIVILAAAGFLFVISQGFIEAPEQIASLPFMDQIIPEKEDEDGDEIVEISAESTLRTQLVDLRNMYLESQTIIESLTLQLAEKDRLIQEREDEIARIRDSLNLARDQNIQATALIYENMDPEEASVILSKLGADRASLILGAMRESKAADVMALMDEDLATEITELLAGFTGELAETPLPLTPGSDAIPPTSN